ncbi:hypothetical protein [Dehalococcoides sp. THU4]|uniref:hypothetical protein n=1 Tax=Dehalococcoides sp. THU4 TaxID=3348344 RepID=UPI00371EC584
MSEWTPTDDQAAFLQAYENYLNKLLSEGGITSSDAFSSMNKILQRLQNGDDWQTFSEAGLVTDDDLSYARYQNRNNTMQNLYSGYGGIANLFDSDTGQYRIGGWKPATAPLSTTDFQQLYDLFVKNLPDELKDQYGSRTAFQEIYNEFMNSQSFSAPNDWAKQWKEYDDDRQLGMTLYSQVTTAKDALDKLQAEYDALLAQSVDMAGYFNENGGSTDAAQAYGENLEAIAKAKADAEKRYQQLLEEQQRWDNKTRKTFTNPFEAYLSQKFSKTGNTYSFLDEYNNSNKKGLSYFNDTTNIYNPKTKFMLW